LLADQVLGTFVIREQFVDQIFVNLHSFLSIVEERRWLVPASDHIAARLRFLSTMELSDPSGDNRWRVRRDFETVLRAMQRAGDRQKALAAHAEMLSDPRLPLVVTNARDISELEGRVLGHGEDESSGRAYLLLEATDGRFTSFTRTRQSGKPGAPANCEPVRSRGFRNDLPDWKSSTTAMRSGCSPTTNTCETRRNG
jgi:hypothetical protein